MCRYAQYGPYKPHFACFRCRKSFKRRLPRDAGHHGPDKPAVCPQCGVLMANMGLDFKPPRKTDTKAWSHLEQLWTLGETFHSCGCSGPGYRPRGVIEFRAFLTERHTTYQANILRISQRDTPDPEALTLWRERLTRLESAMRDEGLTP